LDVYRQGQKYLGDQRTPKLPTAPCQLRLGESRSKILPGLSDDTLAKFYLMLPEEKSNC